MTQPSERPTGSNPLLATYPFSGVGDRTPFAKPVAKNAIPTAAVAKKALESGDEDTAGNALALEKAMAESLRTYRLTTIAFRTKLVFWAVVKIVVALAIQGAGVKTFQISRGIWKRTSSLPNRLLSMGFGLASVALTAFSWRLIYHIQRDVRIGWNMVQFKDPSLKKTTK